MTSISGTTKNIASSAVLHANTAFISVGGKTVGRIKNLNFVDDGSVAEFYEVGNKYVTDLVVINKKVTGTIERGLIDLFLLSISGGYRDEDADGAASITDGDYFNLNSNIDASVISNSSNTYIDDIIVDIDIKIDSIMNGDTIVATNISLKDCVIPRTSISVQNNEFIITNSEFTGKKVKIVSTNLPQDIKYDK